VVAYDDADTDVVLEAGDHIMSGVTGRANRHSRRDEKAFKKSVVNSLLKNEFGD